MRGHLQQQALGRLAGNHGGPRAAALEHRPGRLQIQVGLGFRAAVTSQAILPQDGQDLFLKVDVARVLDGGDLNRGGGGRRGLRQETAGEDQRQDEATGKAVVVIHQTAFDLGCLVGVQPLG